MTGRRFNSLPTPRPVHRPMAQWPSREPIDRFTVAILALTLAITLGAVWFAILPAALDAPPASASHAPDVKAVAGRDIR